MLIASLLLAASAAIPFRGVVEGYYGRPWGTEGRISLMKFMGERDLNTFVYGPKDDPYHHAKWREPYPPKEAADFKKLLAVAKANKINFYWAVHLGNFNGEYDAVFKKFDAMYQLGVRAFAIFFDDFGSANATLHAEIGNRVIKEFLEKKADCAPLLICPNVYWGGGHPYQRELGEKLDQRAMIMWTGASICSDIRSGAVERITEAFKRPPFIWWNWPVNDYCRKSLLLGRTYGVDNCRYSGFVLNPMENCEANKIAIHGFSEWCKDPDNFDSVKSWEEGFAKIYKDPEVAKAMKVFATHNSDQGPNAHGYRREESVGYENITDPKEMDKLFKEVGKATAILKDKLPKAEPQLFWEIEGWLDNERYLMQEGILALKLKAAKSTKDRATLITKLKKVRKDSAKAIEKHQEKFRAATFQGDRGWINPPLASRKVLRPLIENMLTATLKDLYQEKTGKSFDASQGFTAFSTVKSMPKLAVSRDGKYANIERVLEMKSIAPGESFGISVPPSWQTDYFHAKLDNPEAVRVGVIEVSKDGTNWVKLETKNDGEQMHTNLKPKDGWKHARYVNKGNKAVNFKINQFKFDVQGEASPIDQLLEEL